MGKDNDKSKLTSAAKLRSDAEKQWRAKASGLNLPQSKLEAERVVHEYEVHQIELEMQNESLRISQDDLEQSRNTYAELYDYAPVGYFTFDVNGVIRDVNFAGAQLLATEKQQLVNRPFTSFIVDADERDKFSNHLALALNRRVMLRCDIRFTGNTGSVIYGHLQSVAVAIGKKGGYILTSIVDGTVRRELEEKLQKSHDNLETVVRERTRELSRANEQLAREIEEHKRADALLKSTYAEINRLKDRLQAENIYLQEDVDRQFNFGEIIGQSKVLSQVFLQVEQVAPMNVTVLLLGETGTGKGVVARAIHSRSARKDRPLTTVNCTTLPANIIESELFGREKGAFTGSDARQIGRFELADGGTIFLDEIGDLPFELQSKLLRVIQDGEFERLGSPRTIKIDVRIIAATNRNLEQEILNGKFREDLYYRLNVFPITMPPLRQRKDDIPLLVNHFVTKFNKKIGRNISSLSKETLKALQEYHWPGNVRELESIIERAVITSRGNALEVRDRFENLRMNEEHEGGDVKALVELEHDHVLQVLKKVGWRIEGKHGAAILLGLNPSTLRARMRKYGIVRK
jgi:formate hydrogenlyase transcriptional activator